VGAIIFKKKQEILMFFELIFQAYERRFPEDAAM